MVECAQGQQNNFPGSTAAVSTFSGPLAHTSSGNAGATPTNITSSAINTTGANLLIVTAYTYVASTCAITDSPNSGGSNSWVQLPSYGTAGTGYLQIFYSVKGPISGPPVVGTSHTFTALCPVGQYIGIAVSAYAGANPATMNVYAERNYASSPSTTLQAAITQGLKASAGDLIYSAEESANQTAGTDSIDSGLTVTDQTLSGIAFAQAALAPATAGVINPTWTTASAWYKTMGTVIFSNQPTPSMNAYIAFEGDSIADHNHSPQPSYPALVSAYFPSAMYANYATTAWNVSNLVTQASTADDRSMISGSVPSILSVLIGRNDLGSDGLNDTPEVFEAALVAYFQARRAAGWKVISATVLPSTLSGFNPKRNIVNQWMRGNWQNWSDCLADLANDPVFGIDAAASNVLLYGDGTHPTTAIHQNIATDFTACYQTLVPTVPSYAGGSAVNGSAVAFGIPSTSSPLFNQPIKLIVSADFTTAASTALQTITGLSTTLNPLQINWQYDCFIAYSQATANVAVAFGIQAATVAPTNIFGFGHEQITVGPPATYVDGTLATLATTTATNIVSGTPGAIATLYNAELHGTIENTSALNIVNFMVSTATSGDAVTVKRGSFCKLTAGY